MDRMDRIDRFSLFDGAQALWSIWRRNWKGGLSIRTNSQVSISLGTKSNFAKRARDLHLSRSLRCSINGSSSPASSASFESSRRSARPALIPPSYTGHIRRLNLRPAERIATSCPRRSSVQGRRSTTPAATIRSRRRDRLDCARRSWACRSRGLNAPLVSSSSSTSYHSSAGRPSAFSRASIALKAEACARTSRVQAVTALGVGALFTDPRYNVDAFASTLIPDCLALYSMQLH